MQLAKPEPTLLPTLLSVTRELSTTILFFHPPLISFSKPKIPSSSNLLSPTMLLLSPEHRHSLEANYFVDIAIK